MSEETEKWAIVTLHPSLPSRSEQIARARAWGIVEQTLGGEDVSPIVIEDARKVKRTTKWTDHLPERAAFLGQMKLIGAPGSTVFFATPLCVGFGKAHAMKTLEEFWALGMRVYVHSSGAIYTAGDDMTEFMEKLESEANTAYVRMHRKRKSELPLKRKRKS